MEIGTFVFVHDQKIILDYEKTNKFNSLPNLIYVFLGDKETDLIESFNNVFICRNSSHNIEDYPLLTSFTGWYAIWKNKLYEKYDFIHLFEYDINLSKDFNDVVGKNLNNNIVAYIPINVHDINFLKTNKWSEDLIGCLNKKYDKDILNIFNSLSKDLSCGITSNHSFNTNIFDKYMNWMEPMIETLKTSNLSGHQVERSIPCFYILEGVQYKIVNNILTHLQLDSHGTQYSTNEKYNNEYHNLIN
jgi:hypothetical protein